MERNTHMIFGGMVGCVGTVVAARSGNLPINDITVVSIATVLNTALGVASARWPDADTHSYKPIPVILGLCKEGKIQNRKCLIYHHKGYARVKYLDIKLWAIIYKLMGLRKHRKWQSHTDLWILFWLLVYYKVSHITSVVFNIPLSLISIPLLGVGLGVTSHLIADNFTQESTNVFVPFKFAENIPIIGRLLNLKLDFLKHITIFGHKPFKATNKAWNVIFLILMGYISLFILFPTETKGISLMIISAIVSVFEWLYHTICKAINL